MKVPGAAVRRAGDLRVKRRADRADLAAGTAR